MRRGLCVGTVVGIAAFLIYRAMWGRDPDTGELIGILRSSAYLAFAWGTATFAWVDGGRPEKAAAATIALHILVDAALHVIVPPRSHAVDLGHLAIDAACMAAFMFIVIKARRIWPIWLTAFHSLTLVAHTARAIDVTIHPVVYFAMSVMWSWAVVLVLLIGTLNNRRRR